ncbi:hypothetical protein BHE74_00002972 [Ensete ventricosum]|nr:hypothetical protein BHE74_00002972 [Ensete ventricosum]
MYRLSTFAISYHTGISISYRYESRVFVHFLIFFVCNLYLQVTEVFNYSQDDLLTEDMLVLDTHAEVFIWIGQSVDSKEKQKAFDIGQVFGVQGNSFQKKLLHLFGNAMHASESKDKSTSDYHGGPTQRASALAALSSAFGPSSNTKTTAPRPSRPSRGSQRAAAVAALSSVLTAEQKKGESETSTTRFSRSPSPGPHVTVNGTNFDPYSDAFYVAQEGHVFVPFAKCGRP